QLIMVERPPRQKTEVIPSQKTSKNCQRNKAEIHPETVVLIYVALKEFNATNHHMNLQGDASLIRSRDGIAHL
ncbi:hypothetical protein P7K49_004510, partial [Saguinus oedipus]